MKVEQTRSHFSVVVSEFSDSQTICTDGTFLKKAKKDTNEKRKSGKTDSVVYDNPVSEKLKKDGKTEGKKGGNKGGKQKIVILVCL